MFFVISGYVISASAEATLRRSETAGSFLKRRFMRIFPPFWLSIVVAVPYLVAAVSSLKSGVFEMPDPRFLA
jgi:peptidoglycan/LPS O-acetylase OafA/YrhL